MGNSSFQNHDENDQHNDQPYNCHNPTALLCFPPKLSEASARTVKGASVSVNVSIEIVQKQDMIF
jgi:hypothetical protein